MALEPGQVIDQYRLDQTIHRGHATIVYAATDLGLGRKVAFKVLAERYAHRPVDPSALRHRGPDRGVTRRPPTHRHGLQVGSVRGLDVLRHGADRRDQPRRAPRTSARRPAAPTGRGALAVRPGRRRDRLRAQARGHPPRRQAGEHHDQDDRDAAFGVPGRLRHHEDGRRGPHEPGRHVPRHPRLRVAGADLRRSGPRPSCRRVLVGVHRVPHPHRPPALRRRTQ